MKIAILLYENLTALDAIGPYESISRVPGTEIRFVGLCTGYVRTHEGSLGLKVDHSIKDIRGSELLLIPGGPIEAIEEVVSNSEILNWIRLEHQRSLWTCSVCTGSLILGAAGLIDGKQVSTHWRVRHKLADFGARYSDRRITKDGKIITSAGVSAGIDMGLQLCELIASRDVARAIQLGIEYDPKPPYEVTHPDAADPQIIEIVENGLKTSTVASKTLILCPAAPTRVYRSR